MAGRIARYIALADIDVTEFCLRIGIGRSTYYYRMREDFWPDEDVQPAADALGLTEDALRKADPGSGEITGADAALLSECLRAVLEALGRAGLGVADVGHDWLSRATLTVFTQSRNQGRVDRGLVKNLVELATYRARA